MIFKGAVDKFLNRPLRNLGKAKEWEDIDSMLSCLEPKPVFVTEPYHHQKICFYLLTKQPRMLELLDMGLGKSKIVLDAFRWHKAKGNARRLLVCVPNVVNLESWRNEIALHAPDLKASYIEGDKAARFKAFHSPSDLCITTYQGLNYLVCQKARSKLRIDNAMLFWARGSFDAVVWDETTAALMSHKSLSYQVARQISDGWRFAVGMTGTPVGRDPMVLWSQFNVVDRGEALGRTLGMFRQAFFVSKSGYWGGMEYKFKQKQTKNLHRMMANSSIRYAAAECVDLPPKVPVLRPVVMPDEAWAYYHAVLDRARERNLEQTSIVDTENVFIRLRQITSGFVSVGGKPSPLTANPKLDALMELIDELPETEKLVVFNEFLHSGDVIVDALKERGIGHARLCSKTTDKGGELRRFLNDPPCRVFVVNSQSGALGLNLQTAHYVAVYESPVSPIVRQQLEARCLRQGQTETVFIYDLVCKNTIDQRILGFLAEGRDLFRALVEGGLGVLKDRRRL